MQNPFANAMQQLDVAANPLGIQKKIARLKKPKRILRADIPVTMDNGSVKKFKAFRVQYNDDRGPFKGGIRFHEQVDLNEVKALSFWMTIKTAVVGIPMGGGKGGVVVNPKHLSQNELNQLSRGFVRAFYKYLGPKKDVPAPDVNTNSQTMDWMVDEYSKLTGKSQPAMITGKSLAHGGSLGRDTATADGGFFILMDYVKKNNIKPKQTTAVVQGFGNAGATMAGLLYKAGFKVIAISDSKTGIIDTSGKGIDINLIAKTKQEQGTVDPCVSFKGDAQCRLIHKKVAPDSILETKCDILVLAALENQIRKDNAQKIKTRIIVELANGPITPEADAILDKKGVVVIPDVLANAGGVTVSYFEWLQNLKKQKWTRAQVRKKLEPIMIKSWNRVERLAQQYNVNFRTAAFMSALKQLVK